jgi:hypothetical protein
MRPADWRCRAMELRPVAGDDDCSDPRVRGSASSRLRWGRDRERHQLFVEGRRHRSDFTRCLAIAVDIIEDHGEFHLRTHWIA